jgi:hypothetical protein
MSRTDHSDVAETVSVAWFDQRFEPVVLLAQIRLNGNGFPAFGVAYEVGFAAP